MSWWDTKNFTKIASSALKSAQKKLDEALEISESGEGSSQAGYLGDVGFDPLLSGNDFGWGGIPATPSTPKEPEADASGEVEIPVSESLDDQSQDGDKSPEAAADDDSWTSWGLSGFQTLSGKDPAKQTRKPQRKGLGKRLRLDMDKAHSEKIKTSETEDFEKSSLESSSGKTEPTVSSPLESVKNLEIRTENPDHEDDAENRDCAAIVPRQDTTSLEGNDDIIDNLHSSDCQIECESDLVTLARDAALSDNMDVNIDEESDKVESSLSRIEYPNTELHSDDENVLNTSSVVAATSDSFGTVTDSCDTASEIPSVLAAQVKVDKVEREGSSDFDKIQAPDDSRMDTVTNPDNANIEEIQTSDNANIEQIQTSDKANIHAIVKDASSDQDKLHQTEDNLVSKEKQTSWQSWGQSDWEHDTSAYNQSEDNTEQSKSSHDITSALGPITEEEELHSDQSDSKPRDQSDSKPPCDQSQIDKGRNTILINPETVSDNLKDDFKSRTEDFTESSDLPETNAEEAHDTVIETLKLGATDIDNAEQGTTDKDIAEQGTTDNDTAEQGTTDNDIAEQSTLDQYIAEQGTTDNDIAEQGTTEIDNAAQGTTDNDNTELGTTVTTDIVELGTTDIENTELDSTVNTDIDSADDDSSELVTTVVEDVIAELGDDEALMISTDSTSQEIIESTSTDTASTVELNETFDEKPSTEHSMESSQPLNIFEPLSLVIINSDVDCNEVVPGMESSIAGLWDDADLKLVQSDLIESESDVTLTLSSDAVLTSTENSDLDLNRSRETETDASTETIKDPDEEIPDSPDDKMDISSSSISSASFVKCMLEEAMTESNKDDERHSTSSEKSSSDLVKIDSGQTSGDEIDTTTSSDIEIISTPNGEYAFNRTLDLSPLRHAFTARSMTSQMSQTHRRSDSNSSSSGQSKHSDQDQLSPGRDLQEPSQRPSRPATERRQRCKSKGDDDEESARRAQESEAMIKVPQCPDLHVTVKKLSETQEILDVRERKLVELSRESVDLRESNNILRTQLRQSEETLESELGDLNAMTHEFTVKMKEQERKFQTLNKEKELLKKQLQDAEEALTKSHDGARLKQLVEDKDEQISELMAEGEKLSKQQLQSNNIIKKVRAREKELDAISKTQTKRIEDQKLEIERQSKVLNNLQTMEEKQADVINSLNTAVKSLEKESADLRNENEDFTEKMRGMQVALDGAYKEIHELHKSNASKSSEAQELLIKARREAETEMRKSRDMMDSQTKDSQSALLCQIEDLQYNSARMEKDHNRMEEILRQEVTDLQMRLQESENRNQDMTQNVTSATRPLLRQIETLQSTYNGQSSSWEKIEKSLSDQLSDAQQQCVMSREREKFAQERLSDLQTRLSSLEGTLSGLRQEKSKLIAELETERARANILQESKHRDAAQIDLMRTSFVLEINDLKKEKILLESHLDLEKSKYESEKRKLTVAHEQLLREKESSASTTPTPRSSSRNSDRNSDVSLPILPPLTQEEVLEHTLMMTSSNGGRISLYESLRQNGAANLLDNLQSQLKQKEGELMLLQGEISELEDTREAMANELVNLTGRNQDLEERVLELSTIQTKHNDLSSRYNALLQMYGEKVEAMQEIQLDLQDVKDMYKTQIEELLTNR